MEPEVKTEGVDGTTGVYLDGVPLEDLDAQKVLDAQRLRDTGQMPRHEYMKLIRRLKAKAESSD